MKGQVIETFQQEGVPDLNTVLSLRRVMDASFIVSDEARRLPRHQGLYPPSPGTLEEDYLVSSSPSPHKSSHSFVLVSPASERKVSEGKECLPSVCWSRILLFVLCFYSNH
ncbi:hypothetical protein Pcinc_005307 [Petrolisthes cinctipes]|uniref:Uncharacterized protein n=1 Tax=Petrolisthes cinctipes TaxID=88211 RepID=A0AAE1GFE7_PETCI|nr:hypothetical protein Pcinc_005307 [Petrolisthes cinctipes]